MKDDFVDRHFVFAHIIVEGDLLYIQANDPGYLNTIIQYEIENASNEVIRKGHFFYGNLQLRIAHLMPGKYLMRFTKNGLPVRCFDFIKTY